MDTTIDKTIGEYINRVASETPNVVCAYLFGSYARGTNYEDSDIDIAFVIAGLEDLERFDLQVRLMVLALQFDSRIEPHPISLEDWNSINPFVNEIKKTGVELSISVG